MSKHLIGFILIIISLVKLKCAYKGYRLSLKDQFEIEDLAYEIYTKNNALINSIIDLSSVSGGLKCEICSFAVDVVKNYLLQKNGFEKFYALVIQICHLTKLDNRVCDGAIEHYKDIVVDAFLRRFLDGDYVCTLIKICEDTTEYESIDDYAKSRNDVDSGSEDHKLDSSPDSSKSKVAFDLGCGSGVLSYFAKDYMDKIIAIELNRSTYQLAKENLKEFYNIQVFNDDILGFDFSKLDDKADLIICEMLDTALIDEEEVPVLDHAKKYLKDDGVIIPQGIINSAEPIFMNNHFIQYEDDEYLPVYIALGESVIYSEFNFLDDIECEYKTEIEFGVYNKVDLDKINFEGELSSDRFEKFNFKENFNIKENKLRINGIKITSFTKLNENIICGPTPMLNPSILVPIEEIELNCGDKFKLKLEYVMGGGVETIKTEILDIIHD